MNVNKVLGEEIRFLRKRSLLSGKELAEAFGISQQHLSRIERGEVQWNISFLIKVCSFFNIPMIHFIKLIEKESSYMYFDNDISETYEIIAVKSNDKVGGWR